MTKEMIFGTVVGWGLFLFSMGLMCDGLKKVAEQKLKVFLEALTKNRVMAMLVSVLAIFLAVKASNLILKG